MKDESWLELGFYAVEEGGGEFGGPVANGFGVAVLDHDAGFVFGAGVADEVSPVFAEGDVGFGEEFLEVGEGGEVWFGGDVEAFEFLGVFFHAGGEFVEGLAGFLHDAEDL